jgi:GNAT superfamily N-acetyltransferase
MQIRAARPDDAPAIVALRAVVYPYLVKGVAATRQSILEPPPGADWKAFVAQADDRLVGWVYGYRNVHTAERDFGEIGQLQVAPGHRGRGIGGALFDAVWQHLGEIGARRVRTWSPPQSLDFARRRGFTPSREMRYSAVRLDPPPPAGPVPAGVRVVPASELDPHLLHETDTAAAADEPGDAPSDAMTYEAWRHDVWDAAGLDRTLSTAAVVDGRIAAFSLVLRDGDRMWSDFTGTVPQHRGRGLARLAKATALRRAAASGVRVAYTSNDEANAPMLAVNARLGYRPVAVQYSCLTTRS